ncbi:MAG: septum formation protein Maf [Vicingus serpentipes]|nr:septum formation protein Maf [Vicingus serpentipes]
MLLVNFPYHIVLASKSPRRQELLKGLGIDFEIRTKEVEEVYPSDLKREEVALFLSELKSTAFEKEIKANELVITSDTIVCLENQILGKPAGVDEAKAMLHQLSGKKHEVITAVTLLSKEKKHSFFVSTSVYFKELTPEEVDYYVTNYHPFDKAGSYGIQEWIGYTGIKKIEGSYFNVVGLPVHQLYEELLKF